jgi:D-tyrosyl-tRNA(Tyr) deacylase
MRIVVQRVAEASVAVGGERVAAIGRGLVVLAGVEQGDTEREADLLAAKVAKLRIFPDDAKPMNVDVRAAGGEALVVSQFTLAGDVTGGNRPSFVGAAAPADGERLWLRFADSLRAAGVPVRRGRFGADMQVALVNDGPVTFVVTARGGVVGN